MGNTIRELHEKLSGQEKKWRAKNAVHSEPKSKSIEKSRISELELTIQQVQDQTAQDKMVLERLGKQVKDLESEKSKLQEELSLKATQEKNAAKWKNAKLQKPVENKRCKENESCSR